MRIRLLCFALATALLYSAGCGKYGKPVRKSIESTPAAAQAEPSDLGGLHSTH